MSQTRPGIVEDRHEPRLLRRQPLFLDADLQPRSRLRCPPHRRALVLADIVGLILAFSLAEAIVGLSEGGQLSIAEEWLLFFATVPLWVVVARVYGLYSRQDEHADHATADELSDVFHLTTIGTWLLVVMLWAVGLVQPDLSKVVVFWGLATLLVTTTRSLARASLRRRWVQAQNTVIYGAGAAGQLVARKILAHPEYGLNLLCFLDLQPIELEPELRHVPVLGDPAALSDLFEQVRIDRVIVAYSLERDSELLDLAPALRARGVRVDVIPRLFEILGSRADLHSIEALPLLGFPAFSLPQTSALKRLLDLCVSAIGLALLLPFGALIAVAIKLDTRGPVFFGSERIGTGGEHFRLLKFRTMRVGADDELYSVLKNECAYAEFLATHKLRTDPRVTRIGRLLRRTSLDELPQLLNILRGELSLVGPRPITAEEFEGFVPVAERDGSWTGMTGYWDIPGLRPGLTGLWQINGRSSIKYEERVRLDKLYATSWSFALDLLIVAKTLRSVFRGNGAV